VNFSLENFEKLTAGDLTGKKKFVKLFISEMTENELPALLDSVNTKNKQLLSAKAHSIKSNVRFFGLKGLTARLQKIEDNTSQYVTPDITLEIKEISTDISNVCLEMNEWYNSIQHA